MSKATKKAAEKRQAAKAKKQKLIMIVAAVLLVCVAGVFVMRSFGKEDQKDVYTKTTAGDTTEKKKEDSGTDQEMAVNDADSAKVTHFAKIEIEEYGIVTVALNGEAAPETVQNFVSLAESGFYDGLTFHRIMAGFMMQGGDPLGNGMGGSEKNITGEFSENGFDNPLSHTRGAISMARSTDYNSASSQFFIVHEDSTFLDGAYAVFGYVTEGIEVVDAVCTAAEPTDNNGTIPAQMQPIIKTITIEEA